MKKTIFFSFVLLSMSLLNFSCSSDDDSSTPPANTQVFKATINGTIVTYQTYSTSTYEDSGTTIRRINGSIDTNNSIQIDMYEDQTGTTSVITLLNCTHNGNQYLFSWTDIDNGTLSYNVTENSEEKIEGIFSGNIFPTTPGGDAIQITNGEFSINK